MSLKDVYQSLICSLSNDQHIVEEPISLDCGHYICKKCISSEKKITCKACNQVTDRDLKNAKESIPSKVIIHHLLSQLFVELEKKTSEGVQNFKGTKFYKHRPRFT